MPLFSCYITGEKIFINLFDKSNLIKKKDTFIFTASGVMHLYAAYKKQTSVINRAYL